MSNRRVRWVSCLGLLICSLALAVTPVRASTPEEIEKAVKNGVKFLYASQNEQGHWDHILKPAATGKYSGDVKQEGGPTALAVFALLSAGEDPKGPRIVKATDYLKKVETHGIYAVGLRANVMAMLSLTPEVRQVIHRDGELLIGSMRHGKDVKLRGFYGYGSGAKSGNDRSTSQFAVLGMWGYAAAGNPVDEEYWRTVDTAWRKNQVEDGGWNYNAAGPSTVSMTAAGLATLFITTEYLHAVDASGCKGNYVDENLDKGLKWLGDNFQTVFAASQPMYALYGIERCAEAGGIKYFGTNNWFDLGADWIVKSQAANGAWSGASIPDSAFAVLFLTRGRSPVAITKLAYTLENINQTKPEDVAKLANWNQRPRDMGNITRWVGRQQERTLNWQWIPLSAPAEELQDSHVLFIAGNQTLQFNDEEVAKLRKFCEDGGIILANSDCATAKFTDSIKKLGSKLYPSYEFRQLPSDHVIFTNEQYPAAGWKTKPVVQGMSNGSRELVLIVSGGDPSRYWQAKLDKGHEDSYELMADIFAYAIGMSKTLRKGESHIVRPLPDIATDRAFKMARLQYPSNWDPEAGGWRRMAALLRNKQKIEMTVEPVELGTGKLDNSYAFAHLTGTVPYKFLPAQAEELKKFTEGGGTLLVDACGGSVEFAKSMEPQLCEMFDPKIKLLPVLPGIDPLFITAYPGEPKIIDVEYRLYTRKVLGGDFKVPRLRGISVKGRTAVYFSPEDLSTGIVGQLVDGIAGYSPSTATAIVQHLLLSIAPKPAAPAAEAKPADASPDAAKPAEPAPDAKPPEVPAEPKP